MIRIRFTATGGTIRKLFGRLLRLSHTFTYEVNGELRETLVLQHGDAFTLDFPNTIQTPPVKVKR